VRVVWSLSAGAPETRFAGSTTLPWDCCCGQGRRDAALDARQRAVGRGRFAHEPRRSTLWNSGRTLGTMYPAAVIHNVRKPPRSTTASARPEDCRRLQHSHPHILSHVNASRSRAGLHERAVRQFAVFIRVPQELLIDHGIRTLKAEDAYHDRHGELTISISRSTSYEFSMSLVELRSVQVSFLERRRRPARTRERLVKFALSSRHDHTERFARLPR